MSKHTAGKWEVSSGTMIISSDCRVIASTLNLEEIPDLHIPMSEQRANARLIASAPELLEACKTILLDYKTCATDSEGHLGNYSKKIIKMVEQAIAKAENNQ